MINNQFITLKEIRNNTHEVTVFVSGGGDVLNDFISLSSLRVGENTVPHKVLIDELIFLSYYINISIVTLSGDVVTLERTEKLITKFKTRMFNYQIQSVYAGMYKHDKWLLLDSPGLGKTIQTIYLAEELSAQRGIKHCLIICGLASLRANWEKEIKKHSTKDSVTIGKRINSKGNLEWLSIKERIKQLNNPIKEFFIIMNIETLRDGDIAEVINNGVNEIDMVIVDEIHKAKSVSTLQGKNLLQLKDFKYKVACTGTLLMNDPLDAFVSLKWIGAEKSTLTNFKKQYCVFGGIGGREVVGYQNLNMLKGVLEENSLRRTKDLLDLPPKTVINEYVEMTKEHRDLYARVESGVKSEFDKVNLDKNQVLAMTTRLRQATACPSALSSEGIESSKVRRAIDLVDEIVSNGDKVVIMSVFKETVYVLKELLSKYNPLIGTGDQNDSEVFEGIEKFQNDNEHMVFIGTTSKMGTGFTLNRATYLISIDTPWTDALQQQVEDRIHRIGTSSPVFIYRLMCEGTIDVVVSHILETKKAIGDFVLDDVVDDNVIDILRKYIRGDLA